MEILSLDGAALKLDNYLLFAGDVFADTGHYYYGIIQVWDRPVAVDRDDLTKVDKTPGDGLEVDYDNDVGFLVLLIPWGAARYNKWWIKSNNKGRIQGTYNQIYCNLFPDPEKVEYEGEFYMMYLSSYVTLTNYPIKFYREE